MIVVSIDFKCLAEDCNQNFHDSDLLLLEKWIIADSDDGTNDSQDFLLHEVAWSVIHDELEELQTFLHDFLLAVSDAFNQHVHIIFESHLIVPYDLSFFGKVVLKGDDHLSNVRRRVLVLVVRKKQEVYFVTKALQA